VNEHDRQLWPLVNNPLWAAMDDYLKAEKLRIADQMATLKNEELSWAQGKLQFIKQLNELRQRIIDRNGRA